MLRAIGKVTILLVLILASGIAAQAQFTIPEIVGLSANPLNPSPGETFQVEAQAPTFNPNSSRFSWIINGQARPDLSGLGKHTISLTAGDVGTVTGVRVIIESADGRTASEEIFVRPAELILHWVAETYTPRWYKGRSLPVPSSVVKVIAIPRIVSGGVAVKPENLVYRWSLDDQENALVGMGEQIFRIKTSDLPKTSHQVEVTVEDRGETVFKEGRVLIGNQNPKAVLYLRTPLGGIETRSALLGDFTPLQRGLLDFQLEPFFFASPASRSGLSFRWTVSGLEADGAPDNPHVLTVDTGREPVSAVPISVRVDDRDPLVSAIVKTITLILQ